MYAIDQQLEYIIINTIPIVREFALRSYAKRTSCIGDEVT